MYILIKNQEGENMNLLSQNTDFNALLTAMKTDIEAEYEKATGYAIDLDEDSGSDYEVGINVEDSAAEGFCLASGYMYGADSNFDWGIFKVKSQKSNTAAKPYIGLDMNEFFRQKMLLIDLSAKVKDLGYDLLADELRAQSVSSTLYRIQLKETVFSLLRKRMKKPVCSLTIFITTFWKRF